MREKNEYPIGCPTCKERFLTEVLFKVHKMVTFCHQSEPKNSQLENEKVCTECGKSFKTNFSLKRHSKTQHDEKESERPSKKMKLHCEFCEKTFDRSFNRNRHMKAQHANM